MAQLLLGALGINWSCYNLNHPRFVALVKNKGSFVVAFFAVRVLLYEKLNWDDQNIVCIKCKQRAGKQWLYIGRLGLRVKQ